MYYRERAIKCTELKYSSENTECSKIAIIVDRFLSIIFGMHFHALAPAVCRTILHDDMSTILYKRLVPVCARNKSSVLHKGIEITISVYELSRMLQRIQMAYHLTSYLIFQPSIAVDALLRQIQIAQWTQPIIDGHNDNVLLHNVFG